VTAVISGGEPARAGRAPSGLTRVLAAVLIIGAAVIGLVRLPHELSGQSAAAAPVRQIPVVGSVPELSSIGPERTDFLAFVRRTVPAGESVRIVQPPTTPFRLDTRRGGDRGVCGYAAPGLVYLWLVYAVGPHPSTCDRDARWTMYFGVAPPAAGTVYRFSARYALVRR
jgi:hypothetical protein